MFSIATSALIYSILVCAFRYTSSRPERDRELAGYIPRSSPVRLDRREKRASVTWFTEMFAQASPDEEFAEITAPGAPTAPHIRPSDVDVRIGPDPCRVPAGRRKNVAFVTGDLSASRNYGSSGAVIVGNRIAERARQTIIGARHGVRLQPLS